MADGSPRSQIDFVLDSEPEQGVWSLDVELATDVRAMVFDGEIGQGELPSDVPAGISKSDEFRRLRSASIRRQEYFLRRSAPLHDSLDGPCETQAIQLNRPQIVGNLTSFFDRRNCLRGDIAYSLGIFLVLFIEKNRARFWITTSLCPMLSCRSNAIRFRSPSCEEMSHRENAC